jgi:ATP-dependent RNA helicase SUPV3L1/SUV3
LLGLQADEIHLCGDERAFKLVTELCNLTGDELIKKKYNRLSELEVMEDIVLLDDLKPGDCLISFSKKEVIKYKMKINQLKFEKNCAIIYGALPPQMKKLQAKLFNDEIGYLVATDAVYYCLIQIGLGMNLNIKRIIFSSITKFSKIDGGMTKLQPNHLRQIAGRAGRSHLKGFVSAINRRDLEYIRECIGNDHQKSKTTQSDNADFTPRESEIKKAIIFPPIDIILDFASTLNNFYARDPKYVPDDLGTILTKFKFFSKVDELYEFRDVEKYMEIAKELSDVNDASLYHVLMFTLSPVNVVPRTLFYLRKFLKDLVHKSIVKVPMDIILSIQEFELRKVFEDLNYYEELHNGNIIVI